jgi:outer membrane protein TolC
MKKYLLLVSAISCIAYAEGIFPESSALEEVAPGSPMLEFSVSVSNQNYKVPSFYAEYESNFLFSSNFDDDDSIRSNVYITLRECIAHGLEQNLGLTIDRYNPLIEKEGIRLEKSVFDPQFYGLARWSESKTPRPYYKQVHDGYYYFQDRLTNTHRGSIYRNKTAIGNTETERTELEGRITGKFITGLEYSFGMSQSRTWTENSGGIFNPYYNTLAEGSIKIPLLKGFGLGVNLAPLRIAKNNWRIATANFDEAIQTLIMDIVITYWSLYYYKEDVSAKEYALNLAYELLKVNEAKVKVGMAAPLTVTEAKASIARQEEELLVSKNLVHNTEDDLRTIINYKMEELFQPKVFRKIKYYLVPSEKPRVIDLKLDEAECIVGAVNNRQVMKIAELQLRNARENLKVAKNNLFPEVNFLGSLGYSGLGGNAGNAYDDQYTAQHPSWSLGVEVSFPIFYNEPVATYRRAKYHQRQTKISIKKTKHFVAMDVRKAIRQVETNRKRINATREYTKLAAEQLEAEQEKYKVGQSTTFRVLEYQDVFASALSQEIRTLTEWRVSVAALYKSTGKILEKNNILVDDYNKTEEEKNPGLSNLIWR